ncbi:MAG: hypothetical protein RBQ72_09640 [Desulfobacterium sp.]|jgi:hypothetical protein|nr:hypothetical protein [Desulfobacterium sp.]
MRIDVLVQKYGLNERQGKTIEFLLTHGKLTIKNFEELCPEDRRDFQNNPATGGSETPAFFMDHYLNLLKKPIAAVSSSPSEKIA